MQEIHQEASRTSAKRGLDMRLERSISNQPRMLMAKDRDLFDRDDRWGPQ